MSNISRLQLSNNLEDKLIWSTASSGEYVFLLHNNLDFTQNMQKLLTNSAIFLWKHFWKLKLPAKLLMFIWKLLNGALSSTGNLLKCHFNINYVLLQHGG